MKIIVDEMPKEPKECLFAKEPNLSETARRFVKMTTGYAYFNCAINDCRCSLYKAEKCEFLKGISAITKEEIDNMVADESKIS